MNTNRTQLMPILALALLLATTTSSAFAVGTDPAPIEVEVHDAELIVLGASSTGMVQLDVRNEAADSVAVEVTLRESTTLIVTLEPGASTTVVLYLDDVLTSVVATRDDGTVLRALEADETTTPDAPAAVDVEELLAAGRAVYQRACVDCHGSSGGGDVGVPLAGNAFLEDMGFVITQTVYGGGFMPGFQHLSNEDVAAVATYIRNSWGNDFGVVTLDDVEEHR